jgi:hypothetical protein
MRRRCGTILTGFERKGPSTRRQRPHMWIRHDRVSGRRSTRYRIGIAYSRSASGALLAPGLFHDFLPGGLPTDIRPTYGGILLSAVIMHISGDELFDAAFHLREFLGRGAVAGGRGP